MSIKIVRSNEPIKVNQITCTIYKLPGIGGTSLAYSAGKVLLFDTDEGAYRSRNRGDSVRPKHWSEISNITADDVADYDAVALDTVGRALDMLTIQIIDQDPKLGRKSGDLTLQGFGALKSAFTAWMRKVHSFGKDVILCSHMDEKMEGDVLKERFDIQGGSKNEIYKSSDAICKLYIDSKNKRWLDFSPREGSLGKNPAGFDILAVPDFRKEPQFFAQVMANIKASLNQMSEEQREQNENDGKIRKLFEFCKSADDFNAALPNLRGASDAIKQYAINQAVANGLTFSKEAKRFVADPSRKPVDPPQAPQSFPTTTPAEKVAPGPRNAPQQASGAPRPKGINGVSNPGYETTDQVRIFRDDGVEIKGGIDVTPKLEDSLVTQEVHVTDVERRKKGVKEYVLLTVKVPGAEHEMSLFCWHKNTMFSHLIGSLDKDCEFTLERREKDDTVTYTIEEIGRIGDVVFVDGEPASQPTGQQLFG